jgi:5-methylcytosine-specific restriction endonuclease McrA
VYLENQRTQEIKHKIELVNCQKQTLEKFIEEWKVSEEPLYENEQGYPIDWKVRRQAVLLRDNFTCDGCKLFIACRFVDSYDWGKDLYDNNLVTIHHNRVGYLNSGIHIHHIKKISDGGSHELTNLQLLCVNCHTIQPGHEFLAKTVKVEQYRAPNVAKYHKSYRGNNKIKKARIAHVCDICERNIEPNQEYFGGYYKEKYSGRFGIKLESKICLNCFKKYEYKYKFH